MLNRSWAKLNLRSEKVTNWIRLVCARLGVRLHLLKRRVITWLNPPYRTIEVDGSLPSQLKKNTLYIVAEDGFQEQAAMLCPCGCAQILHLNLLPDERPVWRVLRNRDGTTSLRPSVWRKRGCHSHFWFRDSRVIWVNDLHK
ncbi:DUF6527 family protein (plasmid) [Tabrizicola sp. M-4]